MTGPCLRLIAAAAGLAALSSSALAEQYAVIAYSESTGDAGYANGYESLDVTARWALAECENDDCQVAAWAADGCVSLATAIGDDALWAGGYANGLTEAAVAPAELSAVQACEAASGGAQCSVVGTVCSFDED